MEISKKDYTDEFIFDSHCVATESLYWFCPNILNHRGMGLTILEEWALERLTMKEIAKKHEISLNKVHKLLYEGAEEYEWAAESLILKGVGTNVPPEFDVYHLMVSEKLRKKEGNRLIKYRCRDLRKLGEFTKEEFLEKFRGWRLSFKAIYKIMDELGIEFKS